MVVAFSLFLKLEGYAELLVTYDRKRAKGLLRLAMGVITTESNIPFHLSFSLLNIFHDKRKSGRTLFLEIFSKAFLAQSVDSALSAVISFCSYYGV